MSNGSTSDRESESRVYLRPPQSADYEEYAALLRSSADFHKPWSPTPPPNVDLYSEDAFLQYLRTSGVASRRERRFVCRKEDDRIMGAVHISEIVRGCFDSAYLGYWMGVEFAGQGYMGEALLQVIELSFGELRLHRLEANIRPENERSIRLVCTAGFKREGYSPRYLKIDGEWRDHERWAILADD